MQTERWISSDSHVHHLPERWAKRVPEQYRDRLPRIVELPNGREGTIDEDGHIASGGTGHFSGHEPEEFDPTTMHYHEEAGYGGPEQRVREQQLDGIDGEIMFSAPSS